MSPHSVAVDKREIADSLFSVKEQLPDGHYLALMNMLGGKHVDVVAGVPDITNAKLVEVRWDRFSVACSGDDEDVCVEWHPHSKIFHVLDTDRLAALSPTAGRHTVAEWECCPDYPLPMTSPMVTCITTDMLSRLHGMLSSEAGYGHYNNDVIRVLDLKVLATH